MKSLSWIWVPGGMDNKFTWWNGQAGRGSIMARLDGACASSEWNASFPDATVQHLAPNSSDHVPILVNVYPLRKRKISMFRFLNFWTVEGEFLQIVGRCWFPHEENLLSIIYRVRMELKSWHNEKFGKLENTISKLESEPDTLLSGSNPIQLQEKRILLEQLLLKQESHWKE